MPKDRPREDYSANLDFLEDSFTFDKHRLDDALMQQADLVYRVAKRIAALQSRMDGAKLDLKELEADTAQKLRDDAAAAEEKTTEKGIENGVETNAKVRAQRRKVHDIKTELDAWMAMRAGYDARSYAIKDLVALYISQYYAESEGSGARMLKDRKGAEGRAGMAKERARRGL